MVSGEVSRCASGVQDDLSGYREWHIDFTGYGAKDGVILLTDHQISMT
jgi:hypothetical protein